MDRPGQGGAEAGPPDHRRADRRAGGPRGRHQLRRRRGAGEGGPSRCDEPCLRLRGAVPLGEGDHPPGRDELLRRRQHRRDRHAGGPADHPPQAPQRRFAAGGFRGPLQGHARARLHPFAARAAHHRRQARDPLAQRADARLRGARAPHRLPEAAGQQGHHRHPGELRRALRRGQREDPGGRGGHRAGDGL